MCFSEVSPSHRVAIPPLSFRRRLFIHIAHYAVYTTHLSCIQPTSTKLGIHVRGAYATLQRVLQDGVPKAECRLRCKHLGTLRPAGAGVNLIELEYFFSLLHSNARSNTRPAWKTSTPRSWPVTQANVSPSCFCFPCVRLSRLSISASLHRLYTDHGQCDC